MEGDSLSCIGDAFIQTDLINDPMKGLGYVGNLYGPPDTRAPAFGSPCIWCFITTETTG